MVQQQTIEGFEFDGGYVPGTLRSAAEGNDRPATLEALRDMLVARIRVCSSGRDIASMARELLIISEELPEAARRGTLVFLRDRIAGEIDAVPSDRDLPALSKRLRRALDELEAMPDPRAGSNPARAAREMVRSRNGAA